MQRTHHHSLEGNNPLRGTDYMEHAPHGNQGIIEGRPEGRQPKSSPVLLNTVVDQDASAEIYLTAPNTLPGATSRDVYGGLGVPVQGMSSKELRHDAQPGRKRQGGGVDQFGQVGADERANAHQVDNASGAGKTERNLISQKD